MEGPRGLKATEFDSLCTLINTVFRGDGVGRMEAQYPLLFTPENYDELFVIVDEGVVVSHVGALTRDISVLGCRMSTMSIGAVATYESHRGRGLATQLMEAGGPEGRRTGRRAHAHIGRKGDCTLASARSASVSTPFIPFPGTRCPPAMARARAKRARMKRPRAKRTSNGRAPRTCTK